MNKIINKSGNNKLALANGSIYDIRININNETHTESNLNITIQMIRHDFFKDLIHKYETDLINEIFTLAICVIFYCLISC